jgi:hypothetical protein
LDFGGGFLMPHPATHSATHLVGGTDVIARTFVVGGAFYDPQGVAGGQTLPVWIAPYACTLTKVEAFRIGGTGAVINARRNFGSPTAKHIAADLSLTADQTIASTATLQDTAYSTGNVVELWLVSASGTPTPTKVFIQLTFTQP